MYRYEDRKLVLLMNLYKNRDAISFVRLPLLQAICYGSFKAVILEGVDTFINVDPHLL